MGYLPMKKLLYFVLTYFLLTVAVQAQSLDQLIKSGTIQIITVVGNGSSSGAALDGILLNATNSKVTIDVHLSEPVYFRDSGPGQNMIATQVYSSGGAYEMKGGRSYITIPAKSRLSVIFIAYCADFERDNPSADQRLTIGNLPANLKFAAVKIAAFEAANPTLDTTTASQVALWIAAGVQPGTISRQFDFTQTDLALARRILQ